MRYLVVVTFQVTSHLSAWAGAETVAALRALPGAHVIGTEGEAQEIQRALRFDR